MILYILKITTNRVKVNSIFFLIYKGMQDMDTVRKIYKTVTQYHRNFALLHCVSSYPTEPVNVNLRVIEQYKREFPDIVIGYSGHEIGSSIAIGAVALGAKVSSLFQKVREGTTKKYVFCCRLSRNTLP